MDPESLRQLVMRHEQGDRSPELIAALDQAAWEGFHDPWEEEDDCVLLEEHLGQPPIPIRWDPQEPMKISATTLDLYMAQNHAQRFIREERPFLLEYRDQSFAEQGRQVALQIEDRGTRALLLRAVYRLQHPKTDLPKALELIKVWNASPSPSEARAVKPTECPFSQEGKPPKAVLIVLEATPELEPSASGLSLEQFDHMLEGFQEDVRAFFEQAFGPCGL